MPDNDDYDVLLSEHEAGEPDAVVLDGLLCGLFVSGLVSINHRQGAQGPAVIPCQPFLESGEHVLFGHRHHGG